MQILSKPPRANGSCLMIVDTLEPLPGNAATVATKNDPRAAVPFLECLVDDCAVVDDLVAVGLPMRNFAAFFLKLLDVVLDGLRGRQAGVETLCWAGHGSSER
jgi:hypothetical protein